MPDITIGRLRGGFAVSWSDPKTGRRRRFKLKACSRAEAEAEAVEVYRSKSPTVSDTTVASIWEAYRDEYAGRKIAENMKWEAKAVLPFFGKLRPDQIHAETCDTYIEMREKAGKKPGTIQTELSHLRICLVWAAKRRIIEKAPYIKKPGKPMPRERWLNREEMSKLLDAAKEPHVRLAILLMVSTAGRIGSILDLTWDRVDFTNNKINLRLPNDFRRKGRAVVPMNATLRDAMEEAHRAALSDYVIEWGGKPLKSIKKGFASAVERAGIEHASPHDLRRSAARLMAEAGRPMAEIAQYLGHSNTATTFEVYARFSPDHLREAAEILDLSEHKVQRTKGNTA